MDVTRGETHVPVCLQLPSGVVRLFIVIFQSFTVLLKTYSNEKVLKLIEDYHESYCLWDITSPEYKNRVKRKVVLESLAAKHNVTVAEIEKKIH